MRCVWRDRQERAEKRRRERREETFYKQLAHKILEAEKSQDLQLASWRLRRADDVPLRVWGLWTRRTDGVSSSPKVRGLETRKDQMSQLEWGGRKRPCFSPNSGRPSSLLAFWLYSGLQLIGWGLSTLQKAICLFNQPIQMLMSSKNTLTDIPRIMSEHIAGHPMAWSSWQYISHHIVRACSLKVWKTQLCNLWSLLTLSCVIVWWGFG